MKYLSYILDIKIKLPLKHNYTAANVHMRAFCDSYESILK